MKSLALLSALLLVAVSFAQGKSAAQKTIEQQIVRYDQAIQRGDVKGIRAIMAPDFSAFDDKGKPIPAKVIIDQLGSIFKVAKKIAIRSKIQSCKLDKEGAHVVESNVLDVDIPGQNGKISKLHVEATSAGLWVPRDGTYKIKSTKSLKNKVTVDGKPVGR